MIARLSLTALCAGALLVPAATAFAGATHDVTQRSVETHQRAVSVANLVLGGWTVDYDGYDLDNVLVEATRVVGGVSTGEVAASALTYGGEYELWLSAGTYDVEYSLEGYATQTDRVKLTDDELLEDVTMLLAAPVALENPTISGRARVGDSLTAGQGLWSEDGVDFRYQWRADGEPIDGATGPTLPVGAKYFRADLSVVVTAKLAGHANGKAQSDTVSVGAGRFGLDVGNPRRSSGKWRVPVAVDAPTWAAPDGTIKVCSERRSILCFKFTVRDGEGTALLPGARKGLKYDIEFDGPRGYSVSDGTVSLRPW